MLTAKLVSNFKRMEYFQPFEPVDHIPIFWRLGKLDFETARAFLRMEMDSAIYNRAVGRNMNLRRADSSSIHLALNHDEYIRRAENPDTDGVMEKFNADGRWPLFFTHEMLPNIELFFSVAENLKVIEPMRHPVDLAYSWYRRGWGERWGEDPLAFIPAVDVGGKAVPWFAADWADEYLSLNPIDRVIRGILALLDLFEETYGGLTTEHRDQVYFLSYEHLLDSPAEEIEKLAAFLETEPLEEMTALAAREGLPRENPDEKLEGKLKEMAEIAFPENIRRLVEAGRRHEEGVGLRAPGGLMRARRQ
ncbi:MAG: hypothetical protein CMM60_12930 [Rhodospirillaceae bacterium]|jgi:hypothetical protein|nr:hypothetical protein [Rhodospirillaceae bacterium]|tara:strand:+ start:663 stop:1580 length:918 start_codon:yes stop_codon:yes gene_type:complete